MEKPDLDPLVQMLTNKEMMAKMRHRDLVEMRFSAPPALQPEIAPWEHRAFAREDVQDNPLSAVTLLGMIPAYQGAKMMGLMGSRTPASWEQFKQGNLGILDGLKSYLGNK